MWRLCRPLPGFDACCWWRHRSVIPAPPPPVFQQREHPGDQARVCSPLRAVFIPLVPAPSLHRCRAWVGETDDAEMSSSSAFNDEKGGSSSVGEPEYGHDPASGGIFSSDYKRYRSAFTSQRITLEVKCCGCAGLFFVFISGGMISGHGSSSDLTLFTVRPWLREVVSAIWWWFCLSPWFNRVSVPKWRPSFDMER